MSALIETRSITCPHCGETIEVVLDLSEPEQCYLEDCSVCCRPITLRVSAADGELLELDAQASD